MLDLRTPSSQHFTSWWTTSATPTRKKNSFPGPMRRSAPARSSPSPSSPGGAASAASGTFTATQRATCATLSLPCPTARNSTGWCGFGWSSSRRALCTWRRFWALEEVLTKPWTAPRCPSGMRSEGAKDGWPDWPTHRMVQQPGMVRGIPPARVLRSPKSDRSPASTSPVLPPKTNRWPRLSLPCGLNRTLGLGNARLGSVGSASSGPYVVDKGFEGTENR
jgi:hypothetical protein